MNLKIFFVLCLLPSLAFAQTPTPTPKIPKAQVTPISLFKKKTVPVPKKRPGGDLAPGQVIVPMDAAYYMGLNEFLSDNYAMRDRRTADEKAWGTAMGLASGACAGVAGVQLLDALSKKGEKAKSPDKPK